MTRDSLHEAAIRVITRKGLEGLTMDHVAREAGVAKGTLYLYFRSKQDLVASTIHTVLRPLADEMIALLDGPLPPEEKMRRLPLLHLGYFDRHRDFLCILLYERNGTPSVGRRRAATRYQKSLEKLTGVIREGIRLGIFRPLDAGKVAGMFAEASIAMIHQRLWREHPGPLEDDAALLAELFLDGLKRKDG